MAQSAITKYTKRIINLIISRCVTKVVNLLFNKATKILQMTSAEMVVQ